ncbi:MAG: hypothetical protein HETSPECPRED_009469 [Heterodermia speciosa]|uniref:Uncharacterized protein n=1 Tax=Heterodermia speciosa TaxID=116794 RepID=A0A8H3EVE9_9LECA|nr:MAG: hypothetical protein HETSPECPRED_009469 [Heterodermia speciosa]
MSIAVNLKGGPFSQVGLEIVSLATAYQLATGLYGWYKARERSQCLTELLSISGGELVSTSSFNVRLYQRTRSQHSMVQGVVVQDRKVQRTGLPKASTAIPDHPGTACLRALTAGLLCMFALEATVEILQDLIPFALVQLHQDDTAIEFEAALLASLKHWVSAVMAEEDSDLFRDHMQQEINLKQSRLTGMALEEIISLEYNPYNDIPRVIGVLRWILTPWHKRETKKYPTCSLKAWTMALVMESLGFQVQADSTVVRHVKDYSAISHAAPGFDETPYVFLVVDDYGDTDPMPIVHVPRAPDSPRALITMVRGIPWIAFKHLRGSPEVSTQLLADIWKMSFSHAKGQFRGFTQSNKHIHIDIAESELDGVSEHHKNLTLDFSPQIHRICGPSLRHFVPMDSKSPGWSLAELNEQMRILKTSEELENPRSPSRNNCYILLSIICGALYGFCSNACYDNGDVLGDDSEVAFLPEILYERGGKRLKRWAHVVGSSLMIGYHTPLNEWNDLLFEMFLGKDTQTDSLISTAGNKYVNRQYSSRDQLLLGAQANGIAAVSEMLVNPTARVLSFCYIHIQRGQMLSFPLTEDQFIIASTYVGLPSDFDMDPEPENTRLYRFDREYPDSTMRVDVEPCWEDDPRTVSFMVRTQGIPIASLSISAFLDRMTSGLITCQCQHPSRDIPVPVGERWQHVSLYQLQRRRFKGTSFKRADVSYGDNRVLIDATQSLAATVYAACILHIRHLFIACACLTCAHNQALRHTQNSGVAILIPYQGD